MIPELLALFALSIPTVYELWNEKSGEPLKSKWLSMTLRVVIALVSIAVAWGFHGNLLGCVAMSFAIFFLCFDYCVNLILGRKPWYSYLSKSPLDKLWSGYHWGWRMFIRVGVFVVANLIYWR